MTSQPDKPVAAPGPGDSTSHEQPTPSEVASQTAEKHDSADRPRESEEHGALKPASIRIGTQRYGVKPPTAVPKPILPLPPSTPGMPGASDVPQGDIVAPEPGEPAAATQATTAATISQGTTQGGPRGKKSSTAKARGPKFTSESVAPRKFPPPNIRGQLSPDLELEYMEALGEQPLDAMITSAPADLTPELEPESKHVAKVVKIHRDDVFLEFGGRLQGTLPLHNFPEPPQPGMMVDVVVSRFNASDGLYELVLPGGAVKVEDWSEVAEGLVVEARITGHNKGGLECEVSHLRGFIPAGQISIYRVDDLAQFVDQKFTCVITEANPERRRLVLSRRAVLEREKAEAKERLLAELEPGQVREGTVRSLQDFGAFVDLGGVDGLIHISQLSWDRIRHASEVLEVGQKVKVKVQKIDPESGKIGLAFRDLAENPWNNAARDFPARSRVMGTVSRLMEFGAFVRLAAGVEGLIHISELSHKRVFRVSDVLKEGQEVEVMVLSVDAEQQRISLSLKALEVKSAPEKAQEEPEDAPPAEPIKQRKTPLKGGIGGPPTGEQFGLKW